MCCCKVDSCLLVESFGECGNSVFACEHKQCPSDCRSDERYDSSPSASQQHLQPPQESVSPDFHAATSPSRGSGTPPPPPPSPPRGGFTGPRILLLPPSSTSTLFFLRHVL